MKEKKGRVMTLEFFSGSGILSFGDVRDDEREDSDNGQDLDLRLLITFLHFHLTILLSKLLASKRLPQNPGTSFLNRSFRASLTRSLRKA